MSKDNMGLALPKKNYYFIIGGVVIVLLGFVLMAGGGAEDPNVFVKEELFSFRRITLAPFLVILGYIIVLWGVLKKPETPQKVDVTQKEQSTNEKKTKDDILD